MERKPLRRGEGRGFTCIPDLCYGWRQRCWFCGMEHEECQCGDSGFGTCFCGAEAESWRDVRPIHVWNLVRNSLHELCVCLRFFTDHDAWWWFTDGWRGR